MFALVSVLGLFGVSEGTKWRVRGCGHVGPHQHSTPSSDPRRVRLCWPKPSFCPQHCTHSRPILNPFVGYFPCFSDPLGMALYAIVRELRAWMGSNSHLLPGPVINFLRCTHTVAYPIVVTQPPVTTGPYNRSALRVNPIPFHRGSCLRRYALCLRIPWYSKDTPDLSMN